MCYVQLSQYHGGDFYINAGNNSHYAVAAAFGFRVIRGLCGVIPECGDIPHAAGNECE